MRSQGVSLVLAAALALTGAACGSGDDNDQQAFDLTGRVVAVEPGARPADTPEGVTVTGALVLNGDAPEGCERDADGVRVYVGDDTSFTPTSASGDLEQLKGETVSVSGTATKDGDACTPVANSVLTQGGSASPEASGAAGGNGNGTTSGGGGSTSSPRATSSPNATDDEGSISDTEETASPGPENPDDHGVMNDDDNSGHG